jgi:hypothetical protein
LGDVRRYERPSPRRRQRRDLNRLDRCGGRDASIWVNYIQLSRPKSRLQQQRALRAKRLHINNGKRVLAERKTAAKKLRFRPSNEKLPVHGLGLAVDDCVEVNLKIRRWSTPRLDFTSDRIDGNGVLTAALDESFDA